MRLHRFYIQEMHNKWGPQELTHDFWLHDERLMNQWLKVLRYQAEDEVVLFNDSTERQYKFSEISSNGAHLVLVTERERQLPKSEIYLLFSLLKKEKNEWVLQKSTELGVSHFIPIFSERTEKTGFDIERAKSIVTEASEQCGRSDIPAVREPINLITAVEEFKSKINLLVAEQHLNQNQIKPDKIQTDVINEKNRFGVIVGPEGGWSDQEKELFLSNQLIHLNLGQFTLRAETACIVAANMLNNR